MREAVIVSAVRTPVGKAPRGMLRTTRPEDLAALVIKAAIERAPGLDPGDVDDVIVGCAFPEGEQGLNIGRNAWLQAGMPVGVPGVTVNRFCSSGLQAIAIAAAQIMAGMTEIMFAGGVECQSRVPGGGKQPMFGGAAMDASPDVFLNMGLTAENVAFRFNVTREEQDAFAVRSHERALAAIASGRFDGETVPVPVTHYRPGPEGTSVAETEVMTMDEGPRPGTTMEVLSKLKPVFKANGSVTAGNSSQTSDGASMTILMSAERAAKGGLKPLARFVSFAVGGVAPGVMGIGPVVALPRALKLAGLKQDDLDVIELNEAFASQAVYVCRHLGLDPEKVNVNGGAIALGHPLGATGAKLTATLLYEMRRRSSRYGCVTMCAAGGIGAAAIFERL
jgi:acetyl-CoA acyltransferase